MDRRTIVDTLLDAAIVGTLPGPVAANVSSDIIAYEEAIRRAHLVLGIDQERLEALVSGATIQVIVIQLHLAMDDLLTFLLRTFPASFDSTEFHRRVIDVFNQSENRDILTLAALEVMTDDVIPLAIFRQLAFNHNLGGLDASWNTRTIPALAPFMSRFGPAMLAANEAHFNTHAPNMGLV